MEQMSINMKELISAAMETKRRGDYRSAEHQLSVALVEARQIKDRWGEAQCLLELGGINVRFSNDYDVGKKRLKESLSLYTSLRSDRGRAYAMHGLANIARKQGKIEEAHTLLLQAVDLFEKTGDKNGQAAVWHDMGLLDKQAGDFASAETYLRRSLLVLESLRDKSALGQVLLSLGSVKASRNDFEQAEGLFKRALALFEELGLKSEVDKARHNLASIKSKQL